MSRQIEIAIIVTAFLVLCPVGIWVYLAVGKLRSGTRPLTPSQIAVLREKYPDATTGYEVAERYSKERRIPRRRAYLLFPDAFLKAKLVPAAKPRKSAHAGKTGRSRGKR